jgi:hypothetical protein
MNKTLALGVAGAALATAAVGGVAYAADTGSPAPASTSDTLSAAATSTAAPSAAPAKGKKHPRRALAARALHGSFTVQRKGAPVVVDVQRGQVTRSDASTVTVHSTDGFEATYGLATTSHIRRDKKPADASALTPGTKVAVVADDDNGHPTARLIRVAG